MQSLSTVQRQMKGSVTKVPVPYPDIIKIYNQGMSGVDLVDQRAAAYYVDRKSSIRFYQGIFVDLMDAAGVNAFIVYNMMH